MKTTKTILAFIFAFQTAFLFAGNDTPSVFSTESSAAVVLALAPVTPAEATFEDMAPESLFSGLSPVTPGVATFEDCSVEMVSVKALSPETPSVADFTDSTDPVYDDAGLLSPVTPFEADFD